MKKYCIREDYVIRKKNDFLDTSGRSDEFQNDVYLLALNITEINPPETIADVGCGSAFKLRKYFKDYKLTGYDLQPTVDLLKQKYPDGEWIVSDFYTTPKSADMVICADVIEHVDEPDELIEFIKKMNFKDLIISTPDRNLLHEKLGRSIIGPPVNKHHIREWTYEEFAEYIGQHFDIMLHGKIESEFGQMIHCKPKKI